MTSPDAHAGTADTVSVVLSAARVAAEDRWHEPGWVRVGDGTIEAAGGGDPPGDAEDLGEVTLAPGFVDIHCHGGGGVNFGDGGPAAVQAAAAHRAHGTTSVMASLVSDTLDALEQQVRGLAPLVRAGELLGIHLEGPWLSERHSGAHDPALLCDPRPAEVGRLLDAGAGTVRVVTLAVEREGGPEACRRLAARGVLVGLGHSDATYVQGTAGIDAGARLATHLFNAERAVHHREPGLALALLEHPEVTLELIADGVHLHPAVLRDVCRAAPGRVALVSDAMAAAASGDGDYRLGPLAVEVRGGVARLAGRDVIAGSTLTLDRAVRTLVHDAGVPLRTALLAATAAPARALGAPELGRIAPGARADLVALDDSLAVTRVMRGGVWIDGSSR